MSQVLRIGSPGVAELDSLLGASHKVTSLSARAAGSSEAGQGPPSTLTWAGGSILFLATGELCILFLAGCSLESLTGCRLEAHLCF